MMKITEYRKDGWPLCPQCGEDELYSHLDDRYIFQFNDEHDGRNPPVQEYIGAGLTCYQCGWTNASPLSFAMRPRKANDD